MFFRNVNINRDSLSFLSEQEVKKMIKKIDINNLKKLFIIV
jgi:hypothetical protein